MPTYGYECTKCGHEFEVLQSIKAEPLREFPKCNGEVKRLIGAGAGFIFKGSGFYITDYTRSKDYKEKAKSESNGGSTAGGSTPASSTAPASSSTGGGSSGSAGEKKSA